jgi:hypothetical protein
MSNVDTHINPPFMLWSVEILAKSLTDFLIQSRNKIFDDQIYSFFVNTKATTLTMTVLSSGTTAFIPGGIGPLLLFFLFSLGPLSFLFYIGTEAPPSFFQQNGWRFDQICVGKETPDATAFGDIQGDDTPDTNTRIVPTLPQFQALWATIILYWCILHPRTFSTAAHFRQRNSPFIRRFRFRSIYRHDESVITVQRAGYALNTVWNLM